MTATSATAKPGARTRTADRDRAALGYGPPKSYEELRAVLASGAIRLPKRLRQVAVFLGQHPGEVAFGTVSAVAEKAGVQPSAIVRFAQTLGFSGFSDLRDLFTAYIRESWPEQRDRPPAKGEGRAAEHPNPHFVTGLVAASQRSLSRVAETLDGAAFAAVVKGMSRAEVIYLIGSKRAFPVTTYMSLALAQLGITNMLIDNIGSTGFAQIGCATRKDAVLAVSFSPYNSITPELAATAAQRGTPLFSITDSALSPLVPVSDAWLEVVEGDFGGFRSIAATLAVGMGLVLAIAKNRQSRQR